MKICFLLTNDFSHDARVAKEIKTFTGRGHKVHLVCLAGKNDIATGENFEFTRISPEEFDAVSNVPIYGKFLKLYNILYNLNSFPFIKKAIDTGADVYHANDLDTLPAACIAASSTGAAVVYDSHEIYPETILNWFKNKTFMEKLKTFALKKIYEFNERRYIKKADSMITVNDSICSYFQSRYGVKCVSVKNVPKLQSVKKTDRIRLEFGIPKDYKIVIYQGAVGESRGLETLLGSSLYFGKNDKIKLVFFTGIKSLRDYIADKKIEYDRNAVVISEMIPPDTLLEYTAAADIGTCLIEPKNLSKKLALPNKLFEYAMCAVPVLASNLPEISGLINKYKTGRIIENATPQALAEEIVKLASDEKVLALYSGNCKDLVAGTNWETEEKKLLYAHFAAYRKKKGMAPNAL